MTSRALFNLVMITALVYSARTFMPAGETVTGSGAALAFGFLLVAALQIGHIAEAVRFPHLTGYLLCGLLFGPEILGIISEPMVQDLALVKGTAVGLIALLAGCELNLRKLQPAMRAITSISLATIALAGMALWALFYWITSVLPLTAEYTALQRGAIALIAANVLAAFSPAVVIGVIAETKAAGPLSRLCMSIVVLADLAIVVTFSMTSSFARSVFPGAGEAGGMAALLEHIFGSIIVGSIMGLALALYISRVGNRTGLVVFAVLFVIAEGGRAFHLDPLLVGLTAGLLLENASPIGGEEVIKATQPLTLPVFVIFFAVVGAEMHLKAFLHVAPFAIAATLTRAAAIFAGNWIGGRIGRVPREYGSLVAYGLLPQAGVAIALAVLVLNRFEPWGRVIGTLLLGTIVLNELVGPILFRFALVRAGEVAPTQTDGDDAEPAVVAPSA